MPGPLVHRAGAADGPLVGLTFAAKDLFDVAGLVTGAGNPDWARTHAPATVDAEAVSALLGAGATLTGRAVTDELAFSIIGMNAHYGAPRNARAADRIPGGSSSGSASAVAHGLVDVALGTDTGGSVRIPAACNGLYGLRPTHGRVSLAGVVPAAPSFDTCGWFARDLPTLERVAEVLLGAEPPGHGPPATTGEAELVVAVDLFEAADPEVAAALAVTLQRLRAHAHVVDVEALGPALLDAATLARGVLTAGEFWAAHGAWITSVQPRLGERTARKVAGLPDLAERDPAGADAVRQQVTARLEELTAGGAALDHAHHAHPAAPVDQQRRGVRALQPGHHALHVTGQPGRLAADLGAGGGDRRRAPGRALAHRRPPRRPPPAPPGPVGQAGSVRRRKSAVIPHASSAASGWWNMSANELSKACPAA